MPDPLPPGCPRKNRNDARHRSVMVLSSLYFEQGKQFQHWDPKYNSFGVPFWISRSGTFAWNLSVWESLPRDFRLGNLALDCSLGAFGLACGFRFGTVAWKRSKLLLVNLDFRNWYLVGRNIVKFVSLALRQMLPDFPRLLVEWLPACLSMFPDFLMQHTNVP